MPEAPSHSRSRSTGSMFRAALPVCTFSAGGYLLFIVKSSIQKTDPAPNCKQFGAGSFFHFSPLGEVVSTSEVAVVSVKLLSSSYHQFSPKSAYYILSPRFSLSYPLHEILCTKYTKQHCFVFSEPTAISIYFFPCYDSPIHIDRPAAVLRHSRRSNILITHLLL